jgi:hypothetical protein
MDSQFISSDGSASRSLDESPELSFDLTSAHCAQTGTLMPLTVTRFSFQVHAIALEPRQPAAMLCPERSEPYHEAW